MTTNITSGKRMAPKMNPFVSTVWRNSRIAIVIIREKRNPFDFFLSIKLSLTLSITLHLELVVERDRRVL